MRHIDNGFLQIVIVMCLCVACLVSCKDVAKKVAKETTEQTIKKGAKKASKELGERSLREIGERSAKDFPWDEVLVALEKDNPILGKGIKKLSKSFRKGVAQSIQSDPRVFKAVISTPSILDDFESFAGYDKKLCNDPDLFRWFARSEVSSSEKGEINFMGNIALKNNGASVSILEGDSQRAIAEMKDGIITLVHPFSDEGGHIIPSESILRQELRPNSAYKLREASGSQYIYNIDDWGRVSSVKTHNVTSEDISANVLGLKHNVDIGNDGTEILNRLDRSGAENQTYTVSFIYTDDSSIPSYVKIEENGNTHTLRNSHSSRALGEGTLHRETRVISRMEGDDVFDFFSDNNPEINNLLNSIIEYPGTTKDKFIVEVYEDGSVRIMHKDWGNSSMVISGDRVRVKAGSVAGAQDQGLNQFLNTRMRNYTYEIEDYMEIRTDDLARISESHATYTKDNLITRSGQRDSHTQRRIVTEQDGIQGDEGGHTLQRALGGPNEFGNQVPMAFDVNHIVFGAIERAERDAVDGGSVVTAYRKCLYEGNSKRPSFFIINDTVNGKPMKVKINGIEYTCPIKVSNTSPAVIEQIAL